MGENQESFRNELIKLAESVEILENSFIGKHNIEISVSLDESDFSNVKDYVNEKSSDRIIISIGKVNFTFSKK
jgi:hypothetical protein